MFIIPAIDLKDGLCVRLLQGKKEDCTIYSNNPVEVARKWQDCGAKHLHIVDLDGAFSGNQKNLDSIIKIRKSVQMQIEVGGGIRDINRIDMLISQGIDKVILGTVAAKDLALLENACKKYPNKILVGIDARDGYVAIKGWIELTEFKAKEFASKVQGCGAAGIIYTDIRRDGMLSGPNMQAVKEMVKTVSIPVIASGGISSFQDIKNLSKIKGLWGVIIGKALYSGVLDLKEAIRIK